MHEFLGSIFSISDDIRYAAVYHSGKLLSSTKPGLQNASSSESDKYEELIVNPALLTLAKQRGDIDCGGCEFILVRYGNFFQLVVPMHDGHVSVCVSSEANPLDHVLKIQALAARGFS